MKKYIKPEIKEKELQVEYLLAALSGGEAKIGEGQINPSDAGANEFSIWQFMEEDE